MSSPEQENDITSVDISDYAEKILAEEDRPLFDDAVRSAQAGALRAAYVMIWLSCAESLKRRFTEAGKRDNKANKVKGEIKKKEKDHKAVDKYVLDQAKDYGFVSDTHHVLLAQIYEQRCLYGHPYEVAPLPEQVTHAASVVVEHVLSKPVTLREGFGSTLLKSLLEERNYLDDQQQAVEAFTKDILIRLDESIFRWFISKYLRELENIVSDSSMLIFTKRGIWFCQAMLKEVGVEVFSHDEWHDKVGEYPKILMYVLSCSSLYEKIGERAQDSLVGAILDESASKATLLKVLEGLCANGGLTTRQQERFTKRVSEMKLDDVKSAGIATTTGYDSIISALKSHNWYTQNPAVELIISNGPDQASELDAAQQIDLGRNILQAADGSANSAIGFLDRLSKDGASWPLDVVRGIFMEIFTNEQNEIRFKDRYLEDVLNALGYIDKDDRGEIIDQVADSVDQGTPKHWLDEDDFEGVIEQLQPYQWAKTLVKSLKGKSSDFASATAAAVDQATAAMREMRDVSASFSAEAEDD